MSLDNIRLSPIILQQLFKHSLIDPKSRKATGQKATAKKFSVLGNNKKNSLLIVESKEALYLPDNQLNFLLGILAACNLTMEDVAILNIKKNEKATYKTLTSELQPEKIMLFGVNTEQIGLPLDFPYYQVQQYNNQTYLTAPALSHFHDNKAEKTRLWNCLKQIFNI